MRRILILLTSSFPYGRGETFVANEFPYLQAAFDEVVIICNETEGTQRSRLAEGVTCLRVPYDLSVARRLGAGLTLFDAEPRDELRRIPQAYSVPITRPVVNTVLVSWAKAKQFSRILRRLAEAHPGDRVYAYSYWANDMALACAVARAHGWVDVAACRAHRWDVYFERSMTGLLPFRRYLAENLDRYSFVSKDGLAYFRAREGRDYPSLGHSNLGTESVASQPLSDRRPFTVISCSDIIPRKRVDRIAEALGALSRSMTWIHIGDGPSRPSVESIAAHFPPSIRLEMTGALPPTDVLPIYRKRRPSLFINLSDSEGLPVAIMEAMSAGIPVLATAVGGVPEIVSHQKNGLLLDADPTVPDITAAIEGFATMPEAQYRMYADAAWTTWRTEFNAAINYPSFVNDVLGG